MPIDNSRHTLVHALFQSLPKEGTEWSVQDRAKWIRLAALVFDVVYRTDDTGGIAVALENSEAPADTADASSVLAATSDAQPTL